ncbi:hypothetical protein Peur_028441 [Populus x canadensis]|uniref:uncharacterized protein LOC133670022 n=1 Tax=Populus nigra TaxID=3691 RepID=UPI002B27919A|nr:uncharacterized protein LOC133670022 [Populus nigra]
MAHSFYITPATTARPTVAKSKKTSPVPSPGFQRVRACHGDSRPFSDNKLVHRRTIALGLAGALTGLNIGGCNANAAARRPPPPPPGEKKDPSISGLQAKVLASKKRKEAMKEEVARLREKGKAVNEPSE